MTQRVTATRGRPRTFDEDEVLDAALELFWTHGYRGTTTRDLEASLGLSQSSLYNAFGSKAELLAAAQRRYEAKIERELLVPLETAEDGDDALDRFLAALGRWVTTDPRRGCLVVNLMVEDGGRSTSVRSRTRVYRRRVRRALAAALARGAGAARLTEDEIDARANVLLALVLGLHVTARGGGSVQELRRLVDSARRQLADWRRA